MSGFFERPRRDGEPLRARSAPPWMGSPDGVLPGVLVLELLLARNARAAVFVGQLEVYPTGLTLEVRLLTASDDSLYPSPRGIPPGLRRMSPPRGAAEDSGEEAFQFGLEFSDGSRVTNLTGWTPGEEGDPGESVLLDVGGGGRPGSWHQKFWLWPLPPPGLVSFVCAWPAAELALSRADIDAQEISAAAARSLTVFTEPLRSEAPDVTGEGQKPLPRAADQ